MVLHIKMSQWYLKYFPASVPFFFDLGQLRFQTNTLLPVHLCQTVSLLQPVLQCLVKTSILLNYEVHKANKKFLVDLVPNFATLVQMHNGCRNNYKYTG